jgi:hypothetical protein
MFQTLVGARLSMGALLICWRVSWLDHTVAWLLIVGLSGGLIKRVSFPKMIAIV